MGIDLGIDAEELGEHRDEMQASQIDRPRDDQFAGRCRIFAGGSTKQIRAAFGPSRRCENGTRDLAVINMLRQIEPTPDRVIERTRHVVTDPLVGMIHASASELSGERGPRLPICPEEWCSDAISAHSGD